MMVRDIVVFSRGIGSKETHCLLLLLADDGRLVGAGRFPTRRLLFCCGCGVLKTETD